jgi:hypothetical protein
MTDYRRKLIAEGIFFFTVSQAERRFGNASDPSSSLSPQGANSSVRPFGA